MSKHWQRCLTYDWRLAVRGTVKLKLVVMMIKLSLFRQNINIVVDLVFHVLFKFRGVLPISPLNVNMSPTAHNGRNLKFNLN